MSMRMLIDATQPEETRVVVVRGTKIESLDYESVSKKPLKGNIYLAKVTRVEPSLQAAFVDFGGNRHGFLAFNDIHPDYYQIPVADREKLIKQDAEARAAEEEAINGGEAGDGDNGAAAKTAEDVESVGGDEEGEEVSPRAKALRPYKIQEVIKRRQILLIQVVKEERGNKGAAVTTYISLAGRYCVLMPNTGRGGGISRKIVKVTDRKRLKAIAADLEIPTGMGVIVRTAGLNRNKREIKRDYDYLLRVWNDVRELTLKSTAPFMVHEEGDLIKRSIRDLYSKDITEILVDGEDGYKHAKGFMRSLMPSHAKAVQPYKDTVPLFHKYQVDEQLDSLYDQRVDLKSGGYIVMCPTEALVAIDVNSGRATRERNIEDTAHKTNMEAAEEIARQLRLRDMAGLIVIDFIDMDTNKFVRNVENKLKECLKSDRARIQVGRISSFGLLEMSRQRLRTGLLEGSTESCPTCQGSGVVRSVSSMALSCLRALEEEGIKGKSEIITIHVPTAIAIFILNQKRAALAHIEQQYGIQISVEADEALLPPNFRLERAGKKPARPKDFTTTEADEPADTADDSDDGDDQKVAAGAEDKPLVKRRRRRRRRRKSSEIKPTGATTEKVEAEATAPEVEKAADETGPDEAKDGEAAPKQKAARPRKRAAASRRKTSTKAEKEAKKEPKSASKSPESPESPEDRPVPDAAPGGAPAFIPASSLGPAPGPGGGAEAAGPNIQAQAADPADVGAKPKEKRRGWWQKR